jgi:hypothetical protein
MVVTTPALSGTALLVRVATLALKGALAASLVLVLIEPTWGHLEGKAPILRAVVYPWAAAVVPLLWWSFARDRPYPWLADLLATSVGFTDILGNRLDLYDTVVWFDDWVHFFNGAVAVTAALLLTTHRDTPFVLVLERGLAVGLSLAIAWELVEYLSFLQQHTAERTTAYSDTVLDLTLGACGAVAAAVALHALHRRGRPRHAGPVFGPTPVP